MSSYWDFFFSGCGWGHPSLNRVMALEHVLNHSLFSLLRRQKYKCKPFNTEYPEFGKWKKIKKIIQKASPRIRSVRYFICEIFGKNVLPKFISFVWRRHVGVPLRGTNMAAGNPQKHLLLSFPTNAWIHCLRNSYSFGPIDDEFPKSLYTEINCEMVRQAVLRTKGAGGPSGVDANGFRRILACKSLNSHFQGYVRQ